MSEERSVPGRVDPAAPDIRPPDGEHDAAAPWPALLRTRPNVLVTNVVVIVAVAWAAMVLVDILGLAGGLVNPLWTMLFNDAPIEWGQWFLLPATTLTSGYLAARLHARAEPGPASFFLLFAVGAALMMIEDAGDIRHTLRSYAHHAVGPDVSGVGIGLIVEIPYFTVLAAVPLYAVLRYGHHVWRRPRTRPYLLWGVGLYAVAGGGSAIRTLNGLYVRVGRTLDEVVFGGRFPAPAGRPPEHAHFYLVDGPIEESLELIAAACLLAMVLAYTADLRRQDGERPVPPPDRGHGSAAPPVHRG